MSDSVILVVADQNYLPHAKALMVGCVRQGGWSGDFCLMCSDSTDVSKIEGRGIEIQQINHEGNVNEIKFHIFSAYFRRWRRLLYLDCDILIQGNLNETCDELQDQFPAIICDSHEGSILDDWIHFDPKSDKTSLGSPETYRRLRTRFSHIDAPIFTSDVMYFSPETIRCDVQRRLFKIQDDFRAINPYSYDQQVMNLLLYDRMRPMTKKYCTWFAFDDPGSRVPNKQKGWTGDEEPAILHYWGMYAPWLEKTPDAGAYFNHRLGRPCREVYLENLVAFDTTFPLL